MQEVKEFIISRAIWLRGEGHDDSFLLRKSDGKQCCLGIYLLACGFSENDITSMRDPGALVRARSPLIPPSWTIQKDNDMTVNSRICSILVIHNDEKAFTEVEREQRIIDGFAEAGITVHFAD